MICLRNLVKEWVYSLDQETLSVPTEAKLLLYKASIMPYLTYYHLILHFCKASDARKVERVQERALGIVYKSQPEEYSSLLKRANLPSLHNRRLQDIAIK